MSDIAMLRRPSHGEIWLVTFGAARKGEIGKTRPALVVSMDHLQAGRPYDRITVIPFTTNPRQQPNPLQPVVSAGDGLVQDSVALCDAPRAFVPSRFLRQLGQVSNETMARIALSRAIIEGWTA